MTFRNRDSGKECHKKMLSEKRHYSLKTVLGYSLPVYHETGDKHYVDFYIKDPATGKFRRKKYHLDSVRSKRERKSVATELITELTRKLRSGWNPFAENGSARSATKLEEIFERYIRHVSQDCRRKTIHCYTSRVNVLREYMSTLSAPPVYAYQFTREFVIDFLDWVYFDREVTPRTRNNYMNWCYGFCEFMVNRRYLEKNPAENIGKSKEKPKKRKPLSPAMLSAMREHLETESRHFLLACMFEYYCFIRPTELSYLRIRDIDLREQSVRVSGEYSKNKRDGKVALPDVLGRLLVELGTFDYPGEWYLFSRNFRPGREKAGADQFNKRWVKMRRRLGWSDEFQFYSLKDTGIRDLANSEGIVVARDQARHTDISTTNKYLQGDSLRVHEEGKHFRGNL